MRTAKGKDSSRRLRLLGDPVLWELTTPDHWFQNEDRPEVRSGHWVYFFHAPEIRRIKIGTSVQPQKRLDAIRREVTPLHVESLGVIDGGRLVEALIHKLFEFDRAWGEWFEDTILPEVQELIRLDREFYE